MISCKGGSENVFNPPVDTEYDYNAKTLSDPFWETSVIYQETVLLVQEEPTSLATGKLQFSPHKILSIRDYTLQTEYIKDVDYVIENNVIVRLENSAMPFLTSAHLNGDVVPEGFELKTTISNVTTDIVKMGGALYTESPFYYGHQIQVSYVFNKLDANVSEYPTYQLESLPKLLAKLEDKSPVTVVGIGDSVLEGCSSSKFFNREPFLDTFFDLFVQNVERLFETQVESFNLSVGGKQSGWGVQAQQTNEIINKNPDLLLIHFGINDLGAGVSRNIFLDNLEAIILNVRNTNPDIEIMLLSPFAPNENIYDLIEMQKYVDNMHYLSNHHEGVVVVDVFKLSLEVLKEKKYFDVTGNGINHVNDYSSRIYLSALLNTIYKY